MTQKKRIWNLSAMNRPNLIQLIQELDCKQNWQIIIQKAKDKRTIEQNSRLWPLYQSVGDFLGYTQNECHFMFAEMFLKEQLIIGEGTLNEKTITRIKSTTELNTAEMAKYQEMIELEASKMGWGGFDA
jgi:hypothetical protein